MSYSYATIADTISDVLTEVTADEQKETVGRLIESTSAFIDGFCKRPPGYFLGIGSTIGDKQKINIAVDAEDMSADTVLKLTITAAGLVGSPAEITVNAEFGVDDPGTIADQFEAAILADSDLSDFFSVVNADGSLDIEMATLAAVDDTFSATIEAVGPANDVVGTQSTVIQAGRYYPATVRRYRGEGKNYLRIGRHVAGSVSIENVSNTLFYENAENGWLFSNDVAAQPGNVSGGGESYPGRVDRLFACNGLYSVSARWGFAATPDNISMATKQIVQQIWDRGKGIFGQISPGGFVIERDIPLTARAFLTPWIRREFEIN